MQQENLDELFFSDSPSEYMSVPYTSPESQRYSGEDFLSPNPSFSDSDFHEIFSNSFCENWEEKLKHMENFRKEHDKSPEPPIDLESLKKSCEKASYTHFSRNFLEECPQEQLINFCRIYKIPPFGEKEDLIEKILEEELKHIKSI